MGHILYFAIPNTSWSTSPRPRNHHSRCVSVPFSGKSAAVSELRHQARNDFDGNSTSAARTVVWRLADGSASRCSYGRSSTRSAGVLLSVARWFERASLPRHLLTGGFAARSHGSWVSVSPTLIPKICDFRTRGPVVEWSEPAGGRRGRNGDRVGRPGQSLRGAADARLRPRARAREENEKK